MQTLQYSKLGFSKRARRLIRSGTQFQIRVTGWRAKLLRHLGVAGVAAAALTPAQVALILGLASLAVLGGILVYAISQGYEVIDAGGGDGTVTFRLRKKQA